MKPLIEWVKRNRWSSSAIAAILVAGLVVLISRVASDGGDVVTDPIQKGTITESVYGIGTVTATRSFQLKLGVTSTIRRIFVREGDQVKRGQSLVDLDGVVFTAPFDGTVTLLPFKSGETVFPQAVILSLVDLQDRYALVSLEQQAALRVRRGQKAKLSFDSMRSESFDGEVAAVYSNENNFLVRIDIAKLPPQILPGMTADVAISISERRDVLIVPAAAVEAGKVYVKRTSGGTSAVSVTVGVVDGAMAEIKSSELREGDRLVIRKKVSP